MGSSNLHTHPTQSASILAAANGTDLRGLCLLPGSLRISAVIMPFSQSMDSVAKLRY